MRIISLCFCLGLFLLGTAQTTLAQYSRDLGQLTNIPSVSGYEQELSKAIQEDWKAFSPKTDNVGNVYVTLGSGAPNRLIVAAMDEPGYIVSGITDEGFLRVQRLPQQPPNGVFDRLYATQPVWVVTREGKRVNGVFAGLSIHLQPGRQNAPKMAHPDEMFVDIGAHNAEEVAAAGVKLLDLIVLNREKHQIQTFPRMEWETIGNGGRFGIVALVSLPEQVDPSKLRGTLTIAFVTQQWTGGRGLDRLLEEIKPDEMIYVGRLVTKQPAETHSVAERPKPGAGILIGSDASPDNGASLPEEIRTLAEKHKIAAQFVTVNPPRISSYAKASSFPARFAQLGVPVLWPVTPAETVDPVDVGRLALLLRLYASDSSHPVTTIQTMPSPVPGPQRTSLQILVEAYGASSHEGLVREEVKKLLPNWAKTETDSAGNLFLHWGNGNGKTPKIAFVAHMDEIGYQVKSIEPDGRLLVDPLGGGYTEYFLGHPVLVHSENKDVPGVLELPVKWEQPGFEWPQGPRTMDDPSYVYIGTHSVEETQKLGIKAGDWVTVPKQYRPLLGTRANGRAFDDRVGCAALVEAVKALGQTLPGRDVTFIWSTGEELGLKGAAVAAEHMAKDGQTPDFVFAIDTFVSSDSPLESKRFADAEIGKGFVVRAVDNSNITPREYVDRVVKLARENNILVQYGVTGGGNDGSVFTHYGSVDIPLGWPLRYAHSPGEVIDTRDVDTLAKIVAVLAKSW
jgi:putative aminopeptidase